MTPATRQLRLEDKRHALIAYFTKTKILDESRINQIGEEVAELIDKVPAGKRLVLDFTGVAFMSSAMIGKLVQLNKASKGAGVDLRMRNICPQVMQVFRVTRLNKVFKIGDGDYGECEASESIASPVLDGAFGTQRSAINS